MKEAILNKGKFLLKESGETEDEPSTLNKKKFSFNPLKLIPEVFHSRTGSIYNGFVINLKKGNKISYSPDNSKNEALTCICGSSFATPVALADDLKEVYSED